jgi:CelD/BcsL family acetyltransferase involved in cellulose biosynthesis
MEINGAKAAAMLAFNYKNRLLIYNSGYDPANYAELSPGIVLTSYIIEDAIKRGLTILDFLQGNEVYKYRFGAVDTFVYDTQISRKAGQ